MAEKLFPRKKTGCTKCNNPQSEDEGACTGAFPKTKRNCCKCNPKLEEISDTSSFNYHYPQEHKTREKSQSFQNQFIEKVKKTLKHALPITTWLESRREAQLQKQTSDQIDKQLQKEKHFKRQLRSVFETKQSDSAPVTQLQFETPQDHPNQPKHYRLLLIGNEASGKSTILRQMRILYGSGFDEQERQKFVQDIRRNVLEALLAVTHAMTTLKPPLTLRHSENQAKIEYLENYARKYNFDYSQEFFEHAEALWKDEGVQATFQRRGDYPLADNAKYFLEKLNDMRQKDYNPTNQDILHCYIQSGYSEIRFQVDKFTFDMFEPGYVRYPGRKWARIYNDITAIIFVAACNSYDRKLNESLDLFKQICNYPNLWKKSIILFLNKQDLLAEKILEGKSELQEHFPHFCNYHVLLTGQSQSEHPDVIRAKYFIQDEFLNNCGTLKNCLCYPHFTCGVDTENIKTVFSGCCNIIQYLQLCRYDMF